MDVGIGTQKQVGGWRWDEGLWSEVRMRGFASVSDVVCVLGFDLLQEVGEAGMWGEVEVLKYGIWKRRLH